MNLFYRLWTDAFNGRNSFHPSRVDWWETPDRDEAWKQATIRDIGEVQFDQEYGLEFLGSSHTLISGKKLRQLSWVNPIFEEFDDRNGNYMRYEEPVLPIYEDKIKKRDGHIYLISVDVSRGQGNDYSAFVVMDVTEFPYKQVAKYRNNAVSPLVFPTHVVAAARHYNDAYVLVEISDIGEQVANIIHYDLEYEGLVKLVPQGKKGEQMVESGGAFRTSLGLKTSVKTKKIGCANFKTMVEQDKLLLVDGETITECTTFVATKNSYEAASDKDHDDLVMCCVNACWLFRQDFFRDITSGDLRKLLVEEQKLQEESLMPMPIIESLEQERFIDKDGTIWSSVPIEEFRIDHFSSNSRQYQDVYLGQF